MAQDAEYKRAIEDLHNQPKIDYEALSWRSNRKTEEIDIAKLLDEIFEDLDDAV